MSATHTIWRRQSRAQLFREYMVLLAMAGAFFWGWQLISEHTIWVFVLDAPVAGLDMAQRMWPPRWSYLDAISQPLWDTLNIATLGTIIGALIAIPLAFMAARNTTPSTWLCRPVALFIIVASRSINSLIWAMLLVTIVGPGILAGIIAIALRSIGFIGKLVYEAIEEVDQRPIEAVSATGASALQVLSYAFIPQLSPTIVGCVVYRWDFNVRESTVLGIVGAGGLGLPLQASVDMLAWPQVSVIFLIILLLVWAAEWLSNAIRQKIL